MHFARATILVTGGNSGIGRELAVAMARTGARVIVTGRNRASLEETVAANAGVTGYPLDVGDPSDVERFAAMIVERHPDLNAVINNAGMMALEDFLSQPFDVGAAERTIATNFLGPIRLTMALLPQLLRQPEALVMTVSSALAFVPRSAAPTYSASKAAVHSWTQSLRHQLRDTAVSVVELIPPLVATNFAPGQAQNPNAMALDAFIEEAMALLNTGDLPDEVVVQRALPQRSAERSGQFDAIFSSINPR